MPMAHVRKIGGENDLYHIAWLDHGPGGGGGGVDPGYGQGRPGYRPDQGLPGSGGHPDQGLPGSGGRPDQGLPGGGHIANRPPGSGGGGIPDHELPDQPPPQVAAGQTLILVRGPQGHWVYATIAPGSPPPRPVPMPPPNRPDQGLPPTAAPKPAE
jgi:hypothetical protein